MGLGLTFPSYSLLLQAVITIPKPSFIDKYFTRKRVGEELAYIRHRVLYTVHWETSCTSSYIEHLSYHYSRYKPKLSDHDLLVKVVVMKAWSCQVGLLSFAALVYQIFISAYDDCSMKIQLDPPLNNSIPSMFLASNT
ncbi:hypothetical protein ACB098_09G036600 [Castanea mollissima]